MNVRRIEFTRKSFISSLKEIRLLYPLLRFKVNFDPLGFEILSILVALARNPFSARQHSIRENASIVIRCEAP